jgi:hypothetical protein
MSESTVSANREQTIESCRTSLNFLAAIAIPEIFRFLFPPVFLAIWQWLTANLAITRGKQRLAIGLPRGFGKTILLKLIVLYTILFTDRRFILVVCNTADLAENFIADVSDAMDGMNIRSIFGNWRNAMEKDTLHMKKFWFRGRDINLVGIGAGTSMRGINIKLVRPDFIIMDDMQSKEQAESPIESARIFSWMIGTLMKAASPDRCLYVFVGNMYPYPGSILKKLKHASSWLSFITAAIWEDGKSIWEELKPVEELMAELESDTELGHAEIFYAEVMNDENAGTKHGIDITLIGAAPDYLVDEQAPCGYVIIDPSVGKRKSDDVAIGAFLVHEDKARLKPMLRKLACGKFNPEQQIKEAFGLMLEFGIRDVFVESVAYQATLAFWMNYFAKQLGLEGFNVHEIYPGSSSKNARIFDMLKTIACADPSKLLHAEVRSAVVNQVTQWNPAKINNVDDILDLLTYSERILFENSGGLMRVFELSTPGNTVEAAFEGDLELAF